ncbi:uncharacterized protein MKK02DRAFT_29077 [Dioszegia hungarica]|uniref:Uncharacterized protein n=1 Tax=Dioszegia hungarica TaxID=4972 RepID=A0AA38LTA8_9TREE|nr:uncharacterized protein MKK02DRAFT_29077 [Dioszegia hungarica]KAI9633194.1 hypothetical protein MKK02DRAFT_29077 [Dioszegia hungarica]
MSRKKRTTASTSTDSRPGGGTRRSDRDPDEEWDSDDFEWVETADSEGEVESESEYYFLSSSPGGRSKSGQPPSSNGSRGGDRSGDVDQILSEAYLGGDIDSDEAWIMLQAMLRKERRAEKSVAATYLFHIERLKRGAGLLPAHYDDGTDVTYETLNEDLEQGLEKLRSDFPTSQAGLRDSYAEYQWLSRQVWESAPGLTGSPESLFQKMEAENPELATVSRTEIMVFLTDNPVARTDEYATEATSWRSGTDTMKTLLQKVHDFEAQQKEGNRELLSVLEEEKEVLRSIWARERWKEHSESTVAPLAMAGRSVSSSRQKRSRSMRSEDKRYHTKKSRQEMEAARLY